MQRWDSRCPACGEETLDPAHLRLLTPADPGRAARVVFRCERCGHRGSAVVGPVVARWLVVRGAPVSHGHPSLGAGTAGPARRLVLVGDTPDPSEVPGATWRDRDGAA